MLLAVFVCILFRVAEDCIDALQALKLLGCVLCGSCGCRREYRVRIRRTGLSRFLSGCSCTAILRYAFLMSSLLAVLGTPSTYASCVSRIPCNTSIGCFTS